MRFSLHEWRKQVTYFKRNNFKELQKARGLVNTIAFFVVWGYAGYCIAKRADKSAKETGIPHSLQVAKLTGSKHITKWNLNTGKTETIDVLETLAEKEIEARKKVLEERLLRQEARTKALNTDSSS